jgi:hypothetical protein
MEEGGGELGGTVEEVVIGQRSSCGGADICTGRAGMQMERVH